MFLRCALVALLTVVAVPASAQTTDELRAQIVALQQQVDALTTRLATLNALVAQPDRVGFFGVADALVGVHQAYTGDCRRTEAALWGTGFDDSGRGMKHFSLSALCADPNRSTFYSVVRMNATYADRTHVRYAVRDEISQRWWGNQGSCLFCTSDYAAPGTRVLKVEGVLQLPLAGQAPAPQDGPPYAPMDPVNCWEWLKFYDATGTPRFVRACS